MNTKLYIILVTTLLIAAIIGSYLAIDQGEDWVSVSERLLKFLPAIFLFTLLWRKHLSRFNNEKGINQAGSP